MKTFVIGDIHGGHRALVQCLKRSGFDEEKDRLISLGDIADGWTEVAECFEELLSIKNLVMVRGNHDQWLKDWMKDGRQPDIWVKQGGQNTIASYEKHPELKQKHFEFLKTTKHWFVDEEKRLFVHGGYDTTLPIEEQDKMNLMWSRDLVNTYEGNQAVNLQDDYKEIYVGHTTIWKVTGKPIKLGKLICMDTGGGWEGKLSIMNVETKEFWQSDLVSELYPNIKHR